MTVGILRLEVHLPGAHTLKEKRSVLNSLKDQLRGRFNVSVADVDPNTKWQRASLGVAGVGGDRQAVEGCLQQISEWIRNHPAVNVVQIEHEWW
jgi:uncharacterized protein YlxP (DUF503 family)